VPGIFVADGAASSSADRCHSLTSLNLSQAALPSLPIPNTEVKLVCADNTWRTPVAVPGIFVGDGAPSSSADRSHSLTLLNLSQAALGSLPQKDR